MAELAMQAPIVGMMAYHGTPHKILDKFDINKVGTGEGAQAYGHGMYFAENPAVAKQYIVNAELQKTPEGMARSYAQTYPSETEALVGAKQRLQRLTDEGNVAEAKTQEQIVQALESGKLGGNLYKVDIPDADIPNMLQWDKPLSQQPKAVQEAIKQIPVSNAGQKLLDKDPNGSALYEMLADYGNHPEKASKQLNALGIKGIRYLDEGSRNLVGGRAMVLKTKDGYVADVSNEVTQGIGGFPLQTQSRSPVFKTKEEAQAWADKNTKQGTSNFVVFDPSTVEILEENAKPISRKALIEKQVKKLKD